MAFVALGSGSRRVGRVTAASVGKNKQIAFILSPDIVATTGLSVGTFMDLLVGTDADAGFLQIQATTNGAGRKMQAQGGATTSPRFSVVAKKIGVPIPAKAMDLPWSIDGSALIIDVRPLMPASPVAVAA